MKNLNLKEYCISKLLWVTAIVLLITLTWLNKKQVRKVYGSTAGYDIKSTTNIDRFANSEFKTWFNSKFLLPTSQHHFGHIEETLSFVIGKNQRDNTLSKLGDRIRRVVDKLDKSVDNHCLHWINDDIEYRHKDFKLLNKKNNYERFN